MDFFNDPLWWSECFEKVKSLPLEQQENAKIVLNRLQQTWLLQGHYAHYSTLDLLQVYQSVMPVFSEWLSYAKMEFKKQQANLSSDLLSAYQDYLTWFEQALLAEKTTLRTCLQGRLAVGLRAGNGSWDNVMNAMVGELQAIAVLPQQARLTKALAYGHLTPEAFVTIRQIIETDGNDEEKTAFYGLAYHRQFEFTDDKKLKSDDKKRKSHYRFDEEGRSYFIPPELSKAIPLKPPFYRRLPSFLHTIVLGRHRIVDFFSTPPLSVFVSASGGFFSGSAACK